MIRKYKDSDQNTVMKIWLDTNIQAHRFIPKEYWIRHYEMVEKMLPEAELYVYVNDTYAGIEGFIGLTDHYIAGFFVKEDSQSKGVGKQLLDYVKTLKSSLSLSVYQKNERAVQFYQRERFSVCAEKIDEDTNENEFVMMWNS